MSIVVPARNEARHLPRLLESLTQLAYPDYEVIVVDDRSEDDTAKIARSYGVAVVEGRERPAGWNGKQWACHQGAALARGEILLFTDADTEHERRGLATAVGFLTEEGADMISAVPFHDSQALWEKLTGPFHALLLAVTAPFDRPRPKRVYAIGQYLMIRREAYTALGGHAAVKDRFVEDLPLANRLLEAGRPYAVWHGTPLYKVRMYETMGEFLKGWRRNVRAGLGDSTAWAPFEVTAIVAALTGGGRFFETGWSTALSLATVAFLAANQRRLGRFSVLGALGYPFSVGLFCLATALAGSDMLLRRKLHWKGRAYEPAPVRSD